MVNAVFPSFDILWPALSFSISSRKRENRLRSAWAIGWRFSSLIGTYLNVSHGVQQRPRWLVQRPRSLEAAHLHIPKVPLHHPVMDAFRLTDDDVSIEEEERLFCSLDSVYGGDRPTGIWFTALLVSLFFLLVLGSGNVCLHSFPHPTGNSLFLANPLPS